MAGTYCKETSMCVDFVITSTPDKAHFKPGSTALSVAFAGDAGAGAGFKGLAFSPGYTVNKGKKFEGTICGCPSNVHSWKVVVSAQLEEGVAWSFQIAQGDDSIAVAEETCGARRAKRGNDRVYCTATWEIDLSDVIGALCSSEAHTTEESSTDEPSAADSSTDEPSAADSSTDEPSAADSSTDGPSVDATATEVPFAEDGTAADAADETLFPTAAVGEATPGDAVVDASTSTAKATVAVDGAEVAADAADVAASDSTDTESANGAAQGNVGEVAAPPLTADGEMAVAAAVDQRVQAAVDSECTLDCFNGGVCTKHLQDCSDPASAIIEVCDCTPTGPTMGECFYGNVCSQKVLCGNDALSCNIVETISNQESAADRVCNVDSNLPVGLCFSSVGESSVGLAAFVASLAASAGTPTDGESDGDSSEAAASMGGGSLAGLVIVVLVLALVGTIMYKRQTHESPGLPIVNAKMSTFLKNDSFSTALPSEEGVSNPMYDAQTMENTEGLYSDAPAYDESAGTDGPLYDEAAQYHEAALKSATIDAATSSEATYELGTHANASAELEPAYALAAGTTAATNATPVYDVGTADAIDASPLYDVGTEDAIDASPLYDVGTEDAIDASPLYDVGTADDEPAYVRAAGTTAAIDNVAANNNIYAKPTLRRSALNEQLLYATLPEDELGARGTVKKSALGNGMMTKPHTFDLAIKLRSVDEMLLETA
jgi:hypothetical protein